MYFSQLHIHNIFAIQIYRPYNLKFLNFLSIDIALKSGPHFLKNSVFFVFIWKSFKNDKKHVSFHLKNSFRSQDISVFVMAI